MYVVLFTKYNSLKGSVVVGFGVVVVVFTSVVATATTKEPRHEKT